MNLKSTSVGLFFPGSVLEFKRQRLIFDVSKSGSDAFSDLLPSVTIGKFLQYEQKGRRYG